MTRPGAATAGAATRTDPRRARADIRPARAHTGAMSFVKSLGAVCLVLAACGRVVPPPVAESPTPAPRVFQTVDGKRFATEEERAAYLQGTEAARQERALIALETLRQEVTARDLAALQRQRHRRRAERARRDVIAAERSADRAEAAGAAADREDRRLEQALQLGATTPDRDRVRQERDRLELEQARARADARAATQRASAARRRADLEDDLADTRARPEGQAPWERLIRYRRPDEPLHEFRKRVVTAIRRATAEGGQVGDFL